MEIKNQIATIIYFKYHLIVRDLPTYRSLGIDFVITMTTKKEEILDIAETLFRNHGYRFVNLRMIAQACQIRKSSLYYYFPNGKEQIFVEVNLTRFDVHHTQIMTVKDQYNKLEKRIFALLDWFISQPSLYLIAMMHLDMDNLSDENYDILFQALYTKIYRPLGSIFEEANDAGDINITSPDSMAGSLLAIIDSFDVVPVKDKQVKRERIYEVIDIFLNGMKRRD